MESIATPGYRFSVAVLCALLVLLWVFPALNLSLFHSLNQPVSGFSSILWANITNLGDGLLAVGLGISIFSRIPRHLTAVFLSAIIVGILVQLKKYGFNYLPWVDWLALRPAGQLGEEAINILGPTLEHYSFPSGHSAAAATMATLVCLMIPSRAWRVFVVLVTILVALSRAVVGAHWPVDIVAGAILGVLGALISVWIVGKVWAEPDYKARIGIYLFAMVLCASLYQNHTRIDGIPGVDDVEYTVATIGLVLCLYRLIETIYRRFRLSTYIKSPS